MRGGADVTGPVRSVCPLGATLGEGPVWFDDALWCVDIKQRRIHRFDPTTDALRSWDAPAQVGWVLSASDGTIVAGLQSGLHRFDPVDGRFDLIAEVEPALPGNRLNDACVDPAGRLWFGSMDDGEAQASGHIYRADHRGIARVVSGIAITNGPAVSPDGATLYYHDTLGGTIHAAAIDGDGALSDARVFARIPAAEGYPDGPCVDAEGYLWVGIWGGSEVRRYAPDGTLAGRVALPVANVTKVAFGGAERRTAYVTTAAKGLSDEERARQPLAGTLFAFEADVAGLACPPVGPIAPARLYD